MSVVLWNGLKTKKYAIKLRSSRFQLGMTKVTRGVAVHNREVRSVKVPEFA
jgi:hypothetical protein